MKKRLLAWSFAVASVLSAFAQTDQEQITLGYCNDEIIGHSYGQRKVQLGAAIEIPAETAQIYAGARLSAVSVGIGSSRNSYINFFITKELGADPVYTQSSIRVERNEWTEFELTTPYEITGEKFYIGYYQLTPNENDYPIGTDGDVDNASPYGCYMAMGETVETMMSKFTDYSSRFGSLNLRGIITGDNLPHDLASVRSVTIPSYVPVGTEFDAVVDVRNTGANVVGSLQLGATIGDGDRKVFDFTLDESIGNYNDAVLTLKGLQTDVQDLRMPVKIEVLKVNGNDMENPASQTVIYMSAKDLPGRAVVIEEATGTWCQYCPRGYVGMEEMKERYDNSDNYIGITVHADDEIACAAYRPWITKFITGFPLATVNRTETFDPSIDTCEELYRKYTSTCEAKVDIDGEYSKDKNQFLARIKTTFFGDLEDVDYGIAIVLTEDSVGPYLQINGYANGGMGPCGGFENMPQAVPLIYNDVARQIYDWNGAEGSIPSKVENGMAYDYEKAISLRTVTRPWMSTCIALLIDRSTGRIVTGGKLKLGSFTGVDNVSADPAFAEVVASPGHLTVSGEFDNAGIYALDGTLVASFSQETTVATGRGMFIVSIEAGDRRIVRKVLVK